MSGLGYEKSIGVLDWPALMAWSRIAAESETAKLSVAAMSAPRCGRSARAARAPVTANGCEHKAQTTQRSGRFGGLWASSFCKCRYSRQRSLDVVDVAGGSGAAISWAEALAAVGVDVRFDSCTSATGRR